MAYNYQDQPMESQSEWLGKEPKVMESDHMKKDTDSVKITADEAHRMATSNGWQGELSECLDVIREEASNGRLKIGVYKSFKDKTISELKGLGFRVEKASSIANQKGDLYYMIYWNIDGELA